MTQKEWFEWFNENNKLEEFQEVSFFYVRIVFEWYFKLIFMKKVFFKIKITIFLHFGKEKGFSPTNQFIAWYFVN